MRHHFARIKYRLFGLSKCRCTKINKYRCIIKYKYKYIWLGSNTDYLAWANTQTREEAETARTWQGKTMDCVKTSCFLGAKYFQMFWNICRFFVKYFQLCWNILNCFDILTDFLKYLQQCWNICSCVEICAAGKLK